MTPPREMGRFGGLVVCAIATLAALFVCLMAYAIFCDPPTMGGGGIRGPQPCAIIFSDPEPTQPKRSLKCWGIGNYRTLPINKHFPD